MAWSDQKEIVTNVTVMVINLTVMFLGVAFCIFHSVSCVNIDFILKCHESMHHRTQNCEVFAL